MIRVFLDTNVLLTAFGPWRSASVSSPLLLAADVERVTFEKCVYEAHLAFRGIGGKKPDEGRQDWARRYLIRSGDPFPLEQATGKLHGGSLFLAHFWVGQADETQWTLSGTLEEYMAEVGRYVRTEDQSHAASGWEQMQAAIENHRRYQSLFAEFREFLAAHSVEVLSYEDVYTPGAYRDRLLLMDGISTRSTIPSEDFEIVVAGLLSRASLFVSTDKRLLTATASIEPNLRWCSFVHLDDALSTIQRTAA